MQLTSIRTSRGARTLSSVTRAPFAVSSPLMRTTGNGSNTSGTSGAGAAGTGAAAGAATGAGGGVAAGGAGAGTGGTGTGTGGGGAPSTTVVGLDCAVADPARLV